MRNDRIREMAREAQSELATLGLELVSGAARVARTDDEREELDELVSRIDAACRLEGRSVTDSWKAMRTAPGQPLWAWQDSLRRESDQRWRKRLLGTASEQLNPETLEDVTTDLIWYHFHRYHRWPGSQSVARRRFFAFRARAVKARGSVVEGRS